MSYMETASKWASNMDELGYEDVTVWLGRKRGISGCQMFAECYDEEIATVYVVVPMRLRHPDWTTMLSHAEVYYNGEGVEGIVTGMWPFDDRYGPDKHAPFCNDEETDYCVMITVKETE